MGVPVFFVLSGFLLSLPFWSAYRSGLPMPSLRDYAVRRLARIVPGYWLCLLVCAMAAGLAGDPSGIRNLPVALTFVNPFCWWAYFPAPNNDSLWSVGVELWFYALLPLFSLGMFRCRSLPQAWWFWVGVFTAIVLVQVVVLNRLGAGSGGEGLSSLEQLGLKQVVDGNPLKLFTHFLVGVFAADALLILSARRAVGGDRGRWPGRFDLLAVVCIALAAAVLWARPGGLLPQAVGRSRWPLFHLLVFGLLVALPLSRKVGPWLDNPLVRLTARWSFGIYLWHLPIIYALETIWPAGTLSARVGFGAIVLAGAYLAGGLSFVLVERPAVRWARRLETPRVPADPEATPRRWWGMRGRLAAWKKLGRVRDSSGTMEKSPGATPVRA
jgi:peptidoglycan/LPS O-acetylase OafA/YrhL